MKSKKMKSAPVGVIGKVLGILELLDQFPDGLKLKEIAEKTRINKSTAHRFVSHLESEDYLFRDSLGNYMVGLKLTRLGGGTSFLATLTKLCRPVLEDLRKVTGETINLAVLDGFDVLYVDVLEAGHTLRMASAVGTRRPVYCTSLGKAILADLEDEARRQKLLSAVPSDLSTSHKVTKIGRLKKQLKVTRDKGFSVDDEEAVAGIRCLGAAVHDGTGGVVAAISISGPVVRMTNERLRLFSGEICRAAREISGLLERTGPRNSPWR